MIAEQLRQSVLKAALAGDLSRDVIDLDTGEPRDWKEQTIQDLIVDHKGGGTPSKSNPAFWGGDIRWASIKDLKGEDLADTRDRITDLGLASSSSNLVQPGAVIVGMRMGVGKAAINTVPVAINQDLRALIPNTAIIPRFLLILIKGLTFETSGATVQGIKLRQLLGARVLVPSIAEQEWILEKLENLNCLIGELAVFERERRSRP